MPTARFYFRDPSAPVPNQPLRLVVVAFVERDGTVLMERRADNGQWSLLGGRVEEHQSVEDALRLEVLEESGLTADSFSLFGVFSDPTIIAEYTGSFGHVIVRAVSLAFRVQVEDFRPLACSEESLELRFCTHDELRELDITAAVRPIVDRYLENPDRLVLE
jgi:8-oxo-dGTP pyrophosphatase MutT (NUDIX family)